MIWAILAVYVPLVFGIFNVAVAKESKRSEREYQVALMEHRLTVKKRPNSWHPSEPKRKKMPTPIQFLLLRSVLFPILYPPFLAQRYGQRQAQKQIKAIQDRKDALEILKAHTDDPATLQLIDAASSDDLLTL